LSVISDVKLREIIHRSTNKTEQYNNFEDWIMFAAGNALLDRTFAEVEKRVKYTGVLANCVMLDNVIELNTALNALANEGLIPSIDELAALSPYQTRHLKRFGNYKLDLEQIPAPETSDLTFEVEQEGRVEAYDATASRLLAQSEGAPFT
jgi:hypothetical protein